MAGASYKSQGVLTLPVSKLASGVTLANTDKGALLALNASNEIIKATEGVANEVIGQYDGRGYASTDTFPETHIRCVYGHRVDVKVGTAGFDGTTGRLQIKGSGTNAALLAVDAGKAVYADTEKIVAVDGEQALNAPYVGRLVEVTTAGTDGDGEGVIEFRNTAPERNRGNGHKILTIDMNDAAHTLITSGTASSGQTLLNGAAVLFVDPNSGGASEVLTLPPEAEAAGMILEIVNTGGEGIAVEDDAAGAVITIATGKSGRVLCNGTAWYGLLGA